MKKFLLVWLISLFWFIGFSNAWTVDETYPAWNLPSSFWNSVFSNDVVVCKSTWWANWNRWCLVYYDVYRSNWTKCINWRDVSISPYDYYNIKEILVNSIWSSCWSNYTVKILSSSDWLICSTETSKMPVSALSPVVTWITDTLWEFIPYVIYIWLWVLVFSLWFIAVRRLMLRIYNKIRFIFKKR